MPDFDYAALRGFERVYPQQSTLDPDQTAELDRVTAAYEALADQYGAELPEGSVPEMTALADQIEALSRRHWRPEDIARAGAILGIGHAGSLTVERGFVRAEDATENERGSGTERRMRGKGAAKTGEAGELSAALIEDLTAHRTAALRVMLADNPTVALAAVVHVMILPLFYDRFGAKSGLALRLETVDLRASAKGMEDAPAMRALAERHAVWSRQLPEADTEFWAWCLGQGSETLLALLAHCAACSLDAVRKRHSRNDAQLAHADQLAAALSLDMAQWWQPTVGNYLGRVSKQRILEGVGEGVSSEASENLRKLKKEALVTHAEQRLANTGWLPALLRSTISEANEQPALAAE